MRIAYYYCIAAAAVVGLHCVRQAILCSEPVMQRVAAFHLTGLNDSTYDVLVEALMVDDYLTGI